MVNICGVHLAVLALVVERWCSSLLRALKCHSRKREEVGLGLFLIYQKPELLIYQTSVTAAVPVDNFL